MAEYKFIVNTENVNSYGYRIITDGIDITQYEKNPVVLFMHQRGDYKPTGDEVIGKARLTKENNILYAHISFDSGNEFASKIERKVAGGFINMCSMYAEPKETTLDPKLALPEQKFETVTKCKLIEISIVDIGGNDDALRLSAGDSKHKLKLLNQNTIMAEFKTIALALGMDANSTESSVLSEVNTLKLSLETEKKTSGEWKEKFIQLQKKEATALVDKAVKLSLIPEDLKDGQISLFENNFDEQHKKLSKLISDKEAENQKDGKKETIEGVIQLNGKKTTLDPTEETFDYLQKHDVNKLSLIRENEPEKYRKLSLDYANGVRHKEKEN